ncbi:FliM/FliN family flagellar motor switch protein [Cereibacter sediminicola]|uniref:FliM/FliN family flagellar motor switch protein n=1 Tax=Cereibacter sediminicola TaxID=2584941 RepID=UPI001FEBDB76|nr:FliM/FliN family flagellar motor switch protein [Cereibacter sediminicola]
MRDRAVAESVLRRKIEAKARPVVAQVTGAERALRLSLARAARDAFALALDVAGLSSARRSLAELLEMPEERSLYAIVEGPGEGLGLVALSPPVLSALIEVQTIGRVSALAPASRKPTRTDAAMVSGFIDQTLAELEFLLAEDEDRIWAGGFRYASFLDDPRPLGLLLEDCAYRVLTVNVDLALGAKSGPLLLALPAEGRGEPPLRPETPEEAAALVSDFGMALADQVMGAECLLDAVLARVTLPLGTVMGWQVGDVVDLSKATLEDVAFVALDGRQVAEGRLGQHRGMRAIRLAPASAPAASPSGVVPFAMTGTDD